MKSLDYKIRYVQAYIHYMKGATVKINMPRNQREEHMLNHAYTSAKHKMNQMGKEFTHV